MISVGVNNDAPPEDLPVGEPRPHPRLPSRAMEAIVGPLIELMERWVEDYGYLAIFILMLLESALIPFPSEVTMLAGGFYAVEGSLDLFWVGAAGVAGNMVGSWVAYAIGRKTGRPSSTATGATS